MNAHPQFSAALVEPTIGDAITRIEADPALSEAKRSHWCCSLRKIAAALGKMPEELPARWVAIRFAVNSLHHAALGVEKKTLANHVANAKAALAWFCGDAGLPRRAAALSAEWKPLMEMTSAGVERTSLAAFARYCSVAGIAPWDVDEAVVDRFMIYRAEHTRLQIGLKTRRALARAWNGCAAQIEGWPQVSLVEPPLPTQGLRIEDLPPGLQRDLQAHLDSMRVVRRNHRGKRLRPSKDSTIRTRRAEIMAFIGRAVECDFALPTLTSMTALVRPEVVEAIIDAYWQKNGATPNAYTIDLGWKALALARKFGDGDAANLERLDDIRAELEEYRQPGLTEKNRAVIRHVLADEVWRSVMALPATLMAEAARQHNHAPVRAAVLAGIAVAIQILVRHPIRVGNLASIRIGQNLMRPAGPRGPYWLVFPDYDVKNRQALEYELDEATTAMIDRYLGEFRPLLFRGAPSAWLFPGENGDHKDAKTLSEQITKRVYKATGLRLTAHQFRHAAAAIFLKHRPGEYELVRRLLGHRSITTTTHFYAGLESQQATRIFGDIVEHELKQALAAPDRPQGLPGQLSGRATKGRSL